MSHSVSCYGSVREISREYDVSSPIFSYCYGLTDRPDGLPCVDTLGVFEADALGVPRAGIEVARNLISTSGLTTGVDALVKMRLSAG